MFAGIVDAQTQGCDTSDTVLTRDRVMVCVYDAKIVPKTLVVPVGKQEIIFRNEGKGAMQIRYGRGGMTRPAKGRVEHRYEATISNPTKITFKNLVSGTTAQLEILSVQEYEKRATKQKAEASGSRVASVPQAPKLDFYISNPKPSYTLGDKVNFVWNLQNVDLKNLYSCGVMSDGDFGVLASSYGVSLIGQAIGEPVRPTVTYTAMCKLKGQPSPIFTKTIRVSVTKPAKPIIRDVKVLTPKGNRAGEEQVLAFTWSSAGSVMDCGQENSRLGNLRRAKDDLPYVDQMYVKSEWPLRPHKSGRCVLKAYYDTRKQDDGSMAVMEFSVSGTPPPDPKQFSVTNISKPSATPLGPGSYRYLDFNLNGYYLMSGNLPSVTDRIIGDVHCLKAFRTAKVSNIPLQPFSRKISLEFAPGKTSNCKYEVRSRPTGQNVVIDFTLHVGAPTPPQIKNVNVLSPHGRSKGTVQYIDFIMGGESYEIVGKTAKDNCRPPLMEVSLNPNAPEPMRVYEDPDLAYYKHVTYPVASEKSMTCIINVRSKNQVNNYPVDINYPDSGSVNMTFNFDPKSTQSLVGTQPNLLYIDQTQLISNNSGKLIANTGSELNNVTPLTSVTPLIPDVGTGLNNVTPLTSVTP